MGRDFKQPKQPSKTPDEKSDISEAPNAGKRPPKGHRQRGAGTIIKAPPVVTTTEGVVLAPHMRLPTVLLQEFCQREKRSKPVYELVESGDHFKYRVVLIDPKSSRHDLTFSPLQGCESEKNAKEFAALLALFNFQSNLPLERKLPEPFSSTWISMVDRKTETAKSSKKEEATSKASVSSDSGLAPKGLLPIVGLTASNSFASAAERERIAGLERRDRAKHESQLESLTSANYPPTFSVPLHLQRILQEALHLETGPCTSQLRSVPSMEVRSK